MENSHEFYYEQVLPVLKSKVEECHLLGYETVTVQSLWNFLVKKKWKKKEERSLAQLINEIFRVNVGELMNFESVQALQQPNWFTELHPDELASLLKPSPSKR